MENTLSSQERVVELYKKHGVVVFVFDPEGNVLVTREKLEGQSTGKSPGDYSVVCETTEPGEFTSSTVIRGIEEELGVVEEKQADIFSINPENCYLGESIFIEGVLARVFVLHSNGSYRFTSSSEFSDEVEVVGWHTPDEIPDLKLRTGVKNVLKDISESGLTIGQKPTDGGLIPLTKENLLNVLSGFR
jgi:isopentenyldiphosphate isomerase